MKYNFDEIITREGTNCLKYDKREEFFGTNDILPMWIADMDFRAPDCIYKSLRERVEHGVYGYTFISPKWEPAIIDWNKRRYGWEINEEHIGYVSGIVPAISFIIQCFSNEGDKILIQPPVYHPYFHVTEALKRTVVTNSLQFIDGEYKIDFADFENKAKECKIFLLCHPHNPGGRVWRLDELTRIADICARYNVLVVSDEIHCDMTLKGYEHIPYASINKDAEQHSITLMAASKTFNIAGLKSSYHVIPNDDIRSRYNDFLSKGELNFASLFATETVATAYNEGEEWLKQMLEYVEGNIDYMQTFLKEKMPLLSMMRPQASYLVFLDARALNLSQERLVEFFVNEAKVGLNDGASFGKEGSGFMRMNVGCPRATLKEALERIESAYNKLLGNN
ncbi:MAG: pyridoxal phosphate-dependent aminotransferase [Bacteroidaceae bacterium]|nr:pyridoxal phosphate-dependent aminotransferase [Bacteroidaceae bacterium]